MAVAIAALSVVAARESTEAAEAFAEWLEALRELCRADARGEWKLGGDLQLRKRRSWVRTVWCESLASTLALVVVYLRAQEVPGERAGYA